MVDYSQNHNSQILEIVDDCPTTATADDNVHFGKEGEQGSSELIQLALALERHDVIKVKDILRHQRAEDKLRIVNSRHSWLVNKTFLWVHHLRTFCHKLSLQCHHSLLCFIFLSIGIAGHR